MDSDRVLREMSLIHTLAGYIVELNYKKIITNKDVYNVVNNLINN